MLRNKITDTSEYFKEDDSRIILPTDFIDSLDIFDEELLFLINRINKLPIFLNEELNVIDLDDTIYSRNNSLQLALLNENRGTTGNMVIKERMGGYYDFCKKFYKKNQAVPEFINILRDKTSLILTAGEVDFQNMKLNTIGYGIEKKEKVIVERDYMKPLSLLIYIINDLGYIPGTINIYDDRVNFFNKYAPLLSKLLKTNINVNQVTLSELKTNKIESINQISYSVLQGII